jgi:hypothetical protein
MYYILSFYGFLLNIMDYYLTIYIKSLYNNNPYGIINPIGIYYSHKRYGEYKDQYLLEYKLIIFIIFLFYFHYCSLTEYKLIWYNYFMLLMLFSNILLKVFPKII